MNDAKPNEMFAGLVLSLQASTWIHLGKVASQQSGKVERNLAAAKDTIDLLGMLEEKTRGNLVEEEEKLLRDLLANLRLNYVEEVRRDAAAKQAEARSEESSKDAGENAEHAGHAPESAGGEAEKSRDSAQGAGGEASGASEDVVGESKTGGASPDAGG